MHLLTPATGSSPAPRGRRPARPLDLVGRVPDDRTAAAKDDEGEARQLLDDLVALTEAGLVEPIGLCIAPTALGWATNLGPEAA